MILVVLVEMMMMMMMMYYQESQSYSWPSWRRTQPVSSWSPHPPPSRCHRRGRPHPIRPWRPGQHRQQVHTGPGPSLHLGNWIYKEMIVRNKKN